MPELLKRAVSHGDRVALTDGDRRVTYEELLAHAGRVAGGLLAAGLPTADGQCDLREARIASLIPTSPHYVAAQWGIWQAGGVAVPLSGSAAAAELSYALGDSGASACVTTADRLEDLRPVCRPLGIPALDVADLLASRPHGSSPEVRADRRAMMLYTSGTTSRPKGVVSTHAMLAAQIETLTRAWRWRADDCIPLFLPLHHIHGIVNVLSCGLWSGARVDLLRRFDMPTVLERVAAGRYSVFMAVPTIYVKLLQVLTPDHPAVAGFRDMRLMVSGSAALPAATHEAWFRLTGQKLLERYGMTEIGMALSNPYDGERRPGMVGRPLPGVEVCLRSESGEVVDGEAEPGEIHVRGPGVFTEYWGRPQQTADAFTPDGWFRTGDMAVREDGSYRIFGRASVDIIKSGGYKLSALEIEAALLEHEAVAECAVVGVPDETWGERVAVAVVRVDGSDLDEQLLLEWGRSRISAYKLPRTVRFVDGLPRNAMGKVTKPAVRELFGESG